jgi:hypothetical protein
VRVFEIAAARPELRREVTSVAPFPSLMDLLADPRVAFFTADGRRALTSSDERYDLAQGGCCVAPPRPPAALAGVNPPRSAACCYLTSRDFQSGVPGVFSCDRAFSTAKLAIFSTTHGKWASFRLR